jgi:alkaline phosphatase D
MRLAEEIFNTTARVMPQRQVPTTTLLKAAGLKTTTRMDSKAASLLSSGLVQSPLLRKFAVATKLQALSSPRIFVLYRSDDEFTDKYTKLQKVVIPFGSADERALTNVRQFYHRPTNTLHLRPSSNVGEAVRLAIVSLSSPAFRGFFGPQFDNGLQSYFTNLILVEQGLAQTTPEPNMDGLRRATDLVRVAGLEMVSKAYFIDHLDLIRHLNTKLAIGPVRTEELARDALCKTELLSTARFAGQQVEQMVSVGAVGANSVRIWMRTDVPGMHELQILDGSRVIRNSKIMISPSGDQTATITCPTPNDRPLDPLRKYEYRVVRAGQNTSLGQGSFETAPPSDERTPKKVVIAVTSCHQPFAADGTLDLQAARMLRLLPGILKDNNVKFVLACGDQMYADHPGRFSLFRNPYLIRGASGGKTDIKECTDQEVRRAYDMRYRMFWSMPQIREMYANYPCYPAIDDHEIKDAWGSLPEHSDPMHLTIKHGARLAYFDYQASAFLPPLPRLPRSFHYNFSYGNIGVFVMDIRSERTAGSRPQMFSVAQLNDLREFLRQNAGKKVLLIMSSVPIVFSPTGFADVAAKFGSTAFLDHWSDRKNIPARNALLGLLHEHQQRNPHQRVAIVSGDIHIGNALTIKWRGGNKPRLYQFTSSAITNAEGYWTRTGIKIPPASVSNVDFPPPCFGGRCSGEISHLPGMNDASSNNPFTGRNLGLIEITRFGDVSNLKFKLIGVHPTEDRAVVYFESGYLG